MKIGDTVRLVRFNRIGTIIDIQKSLNNKNIFIIKYNEYESEGLYENELELV